MTLTNALTALDTIKNGRYMTIVKSKDLGNGITKVSKMNVRKGITYANMQVNKDRQTESLKYGSWVAGQENVLLEHKGNYYLRITSKTPDNPDCDTIDTHYYQNGKEVTRAAVETLVPASKLKSSTSKVYNIKLDNIISIN